MVCSREPKLEASRLIPARCKKGVSSHGAVPSLWREDLAKSDRQRAFRRLRPAGIGEIILYLLAAYACCPFFRIPIGNNFSRGSMGGQIPTLDVQKLARAQAWIYINCCEIIGPLVCKVLCRRISLSDSLYGIPSKTRDANSVCQAGSMASSSEPLAAFDVAPIVSYAAALPEPTKMSVVAQYRAP